ncbi:MAG TPA: hypothetical protein VGO47_04715 [Chlamydiales bacterium]|nr:hypothetical protein [Chlamydiales bacterium]
MAPISLQNGILACLLSPIGKSDWLSKLFLLDLLDNLPRLCLSCAQMELFIWVLNQTGARNVPTIDQLCHFQQKLKQKLIAVTTRRFKSDLGNVFWANDIGDLIAKVCACQFLSKHSLTVSSIVVAGFCYAACVVIAAILSGRTSWAIRGGLAGYESAESPSRFLNPNVSSWAQRFLCPGAGANARWSIYTACEMDHPCG